MTSSNEKEITKRDVDILTWVSVFLLPVVMTLHGFVTQSLWNWFFFPLGIPEISFFHALGITLVTRFFTFRLRPRENPKDTKEAYENLKHVISVSIITPIVFLSMGFLVHLMM